MVKIAIDAMGGDNGPSTVLAGADIALVRRPELTFQLFGDEQAVLPLLDNYPRLKAVSTFTHCEVTVQMDDKPSQALRKGRWKSSMWRALEAVKKGEADVALSAGNTGALMAMSKFCLRTMAGIERPALAALWPTMRGESVVLDVGATINADAQQLIDFAMMGGAMARALLDVERPTVGLLNIGVEEMKGLEEVRVAGQILKEANLDHLEYVGFVEGDDIGRGTVDVVVTEAFAGNIALKTAEGTARQIGSYLRDAMGRTLLGRIGYFFAQGAFKELRQKLDPRASNGAVLLGLNGIVIKSHGGTDGEGFANAVEVGYSMARNGLLAKISQDLGDYHRAGFVREVAEIVNEGAP
ncbi:phosphate acyltransferase PlsX [Kaistia dalseonensis]|uniref:Phosphate acyltransferase n=1 Tax=Kaistia dalseonensis TaxID=410840 RepID=A0ABU0H1K7_9HYPH|nr:phosphate acyltransferase PlsX [Kaistia dalseonensis]MCX5493632.1 phosphate acyltransferase PlsX [Kaistia dalseonensis]MDQ0436193.1 glycerol-3-phosphate acyltransferase PlsX [Kaistia dalseonensis]